MKQLYPKHKKAFRENVENEMNWMFGVPAIVADNEDPERQHRIRVIIPSIDDKKIFDEWARQLIPCMGNGFGMVFIPPVNSEVVLFGQLGQKFNLFYAGVYNETHEIPPDFVRPDGVQDQTIAGFRVEGDAKLIAQLDFQIRAGRLRIESDASIEISSPAGVYINGKPA
ncbi:MAG: phage baseplate assembly protein V [Acidobacteriota bacterium]|nr:phage baseplate assembly protein V [Acidobacteriota bacterium]